MSDPDALGERLAELRRDRESADQREAAVREVAQTIAQSAFDLDVVFQTVTDQAVRLCHADDGNLALQHGDV